MAPCLRKTPPTAVAAAAAVLLVVVLTLCLAAAQPAVAALSPDQVVLVVNGNVPSSRELAEYYAKLRHVPAGRIVALNLPFNFKLEETTHGQYEFAVARIVREFLVKNGLERTVTCAVTFYGVPLRIRARANTPAEAAERAALDAELARVKAELQSAVADAERLATEADASFKPAGDGTDAAQLARRAEAALAPDTLRHVQTFPDAASRAGLVRRAEALVEKLGGPAQATEFRASPGLAGLVAGPATAAQAEQARRELAGRLKQVSDARFDMAGDPKAREHARQIVRNNLGLFRYATYLEGQKKLLDDAETGSALDSELALLWWGDYPRARWLPNVLHYRAAGQIKTPLPPMLMVTRLDGPTPQIVKDMITASVEVERQGLSGRVVLDGRGLTGDDAYAQYDKTIRHLAGLLKDKSKLDVVFDDEPAVLQPPNPGGVRVENVAAYCGWYSVNHYVPALRLRRGAVAFHVASFEMVSLRDPKNQGWVPGLLNAGAASSLGPVAEPYLHSFPAADEFFPLLFTGKLTLAEVYWKTTPLASWMISCVGDPLYTPYRANPALRAEDLPAPLRAAFTGEALPTTRPAP